MIPLILLAIGIFLIIHNYKKINKVEQSFSFKLNEEKENLNDYKLELGILRRDIGESLTELQQEIKNIKINMNMVNDIEKEYDNILDRDIYDFNSNATEEISIKKEFEYKKKDNDKLKKDNIGVVSQINFNNKKIFNDKMREPSYEISDMETLNEIEENFNKNENHEISNESNKQFTISNLIKKGFTDEEICKQLSISKGEVLLVRNLFEN